MAGPAGTAPAFEDLTARARIRDAALALFAERGIDAATIRDIARAAGVSAGLVRHHFGSKEALRDACDSYALDRLMRIKEEAVVEGQMTNPAFLPAAHPTILLLYRYFARSLVDGSPAAAALFDHMVDLAEEWLARHHPGQFADPRAYSAVLVAMQTGMLAMHEHLSRALGSDILTAAGHLRMARAALDVYSQPLINTELAEGARAAFDQIQSRSTPPAQPPIAAEGARR
jgi:TetR/AcrR family transcriptional regulator, regulator of cefoperazone and chloramphenicol sensitivity